MNIQVEDINETRKKVVASLTGTEITEAEQLVMRDFSKQARLPGFRPGKAPANLIKSRYKKEISGELSRKLTSQAFEKAIKEGDLQVVAVVDAEDKTFTAGQDETLTFTLDVNPTFELPDYKGVPVTIPPSEPTDQEYEQTRDYILNQRAEYDIAEKAAEAGDYVKLDYSGTVEGSPVSELATDLPVYGEQNGTWEEAGNQTVPGVRSVIDALVGMKAGDEKDVEHTFPEDFEVEALRGKTATYHVKVHEVREKKLPKLDDPEFLKGFGAESAEDFEKKIRDDIRSQKEEHSNRVKRDGVIGELAKRVDFPLPESAVESETQRMLREFMARRMTQGASQEEFEQHREQLVTGATNAARERIKAQFILQAIAKKENIEVGDTDLQQAIINRAMASRTKPEDLVKQLSQDRSQLAAFRDTVLFNKTLDFLAKEATVTVGEPTPEPEPAKAD